jgi:dihydroflavonol-4-reductase
LGNKGSSAVPQTVLLTGASGYIAKYVALHLLNAGYHVRGTLRSLSRADEVRSAVLPHLHNASGLDSRLTFVALDLAKDDGWEDAMKGVDVVMHTASPFPMVQPKNEEDLIGPAVSGALRAVKAAHAAGIERFVMTSSTVAIMGSALPGGDTAFDETNWTDPDDPDITAYHKSKTLAEKAVWDYQRDHAPDLKITMINPGLVVGAPLDANFGTSVAIIARLLRGKDPMLPKIGFTVVDVEDVAEMHVNAISNPETYGQRIMTVDRFMWFTDVAQAIKTALPDRRVPTRVAPNFIVRFLGLFDPAIKSILPTLGRLDKIDNSRAKATLGRGMRQAPKSIGSTARYLVENRLV